MIQRTRNKKLTSFSNVFHLIVRYKTGWKYGNPKVYSLPHGQGKITVGKLARLANGSAVMEMGGTSVLATVVSSSQQTDGASFLPLNVIYRQKASATGRIPTNFLRRDLAQSSHEILTSRRIDRCLRPMFPENFYSDTNISCNLLAYDKVNNPDVAAINAASAALAVSDIPMLDTVGAVRVGWVNNAPILNPSREQQEHSDLDLVIAARGDKSVVMLEGSAAELPPPQFISAVQFGAEQASSVAGIIQGLQRQVGAFKVAPAIPADSTQLQQWLLNNYQKFLVDVYSNNGHDKLSRDNAIQSIVHHAVSAALQLPEFSSLTSSCITEEFYKLSKSILRDRILDLGLRPDGRTLSAIRSLSCEVDIHKPLHGSSLFQRGQTQVMASVTLDSLEMMARTDPVSEALVGRPEKNFMLHYEFPQYATGELDTGASRANRREIGHGALAERGLQPVIPKDFPFTVRVFAEVLESNGSSSMASVCAGSLALLDAGVPLSSPAAGVAMGLVTRYDSKGHLLKHAILHDILGMEDYAGDIDFKIAATKKGITALQADVKIPGIPFNIVEELFVQSNQPLKTILDVMKEKISEPRSDRKDSWPASEKLTVTPQQRSKLTGVGGANIKRIQSSTGVTVTTNEDLSLQLFAPSSSSLKQAMSMFLELMDQKNPIELEFGNVYTGKIVELGKNGAYVLIHPQMNPVFVRNSQLDLKLIHHSEAAGLPVGETIHIKYFGADPVSGEGRWSRRALLSPGGYSKRFIPRDDQNRSEHLVKKIPESNGRITADSSSSHNMDTLSPTPVEDRYISPPSIDDKVIESLDSSNDNELPSDMSTEVSSDLLNDDTESVAVDTKNRNGR